MLEKNTNPRAFACTSLAITDKNNYVYHGRTLEFSSDEPESILTYYPKNHIFQRKAPDGSLGLKYKVKYPFIAITAPVSILGERDVLEGVNSGGLAFSLNMITDSELAPLNPKKYTKAVPIASIGEWALSQYATVAELKKAIPKTAFWSQKLLLLRNMPSPFHYAFYDRTGVCIVVEVSKGVLHVYDNPTRCMTNGPEFPWHLTNLNNYTQLSNVDVSSSTLGNMKLSQPDSGIALAAVPNADTSVGRFVRAVYYSTYYHKVSDPNVQLVELGHVMNKFDRPKNASVDPLLGEDDIFKLYLTEFSVWTVLTDLQRGILLFRGYNNLNYQKFTIEQFENEQQPVFIHVNVPNPALV